MGKLSYLICISKAILAVIFVNHEPYVVLGVRNNDLAIDFLLLGFL